MGWRRDTYVQDCKRHAHLILQSPPRSNITSTVPHHSQISKVRLHASRRQPLPKTGRITPRTTAELPRNFLAASASASSSATKGSRASSGSVSRSLQLWRQWLTARRKLQHLNSYFLNLNHPLWSESKGAGCRTRAASKCQAQGLRHAVATNRPHSIGLYASDEELTPQGAAT